MRDSSPHVRAWTVQLALEGGKPPFDGFVKKLTTMAGSDPSPVVRLYLASAAQRLPVESRWELVRKLIGHAEDAADHNLPLMVWYAAEPLAEVDLSRALAMAAEAKLPNVFPYTVQRIAAMRTPEALRVLSERLARTADPAQQQDLVNGITQIVGKK